MSASVSSSSPESSLFRTFPFRIALFLGAMCVIAVLVWQGIASHGTSDPALPTTSPAVAFMDIGVLVFREGLECVLVLSAITASMVGMNREHRHPVAVGAGIGFIATLITWFVAVGILNQLTESVPPWTYRRRLGLLAVIGPACHHELVLPQGLLGRMDLPA